MDHSTGECARVKFIAFIKDKFRSFDQIKLRLRAPGHPTELMQLSLSAIKDQATLVEYFKVGPKLRSEGSTPTQLVFNVTTEDLGLVFQPKYLIIKDEGSKQLALDTESEENIEEHPPIKDEGDIQILQCE